MDKQVKVQLLYSKQDKSVYFKMLFGNQPDDLQIARDFCSHVGFRFDSQNMPWIQMRLSTIPRNDGKSPFDIFMDKRIYDMALAKAKAKGYSCIDGSDQSIKSAGDVIIKEKKALENYPKIKDATKDIVEYVLNAIENGFVDPSLQALIKSISNIDINDPTSVIFNKNKYSIKNKINAWAQWRKAGKAGVPTDMYTFNGWVLRGRIPVTDATPIILVGIGEDDRRGGNNIKNGISRNDMNGFNARLAYDRTDTFTGGNKKYYLFAVYDVSETRPFNSYLNDRYTNDVNMGNMDGVLRDKNGNDGNTFNGNNNDLDKAIKNSEEKSGDKPNDPSIYINNLAKSIEGNPQYSKAYDLIKSGNAPFRDIISAYFSQTDLIDRERNENIKNIKLTLLVGTALIWLNVDKPYGIALIKNQHQNVLDYGVDISDVIGEISDFLNLVEPSNMQESVIRILESAPTENWLLNMLQITPQEYQESQMSHKEHMEEEKSIKENFEKVWNKLIRVNSINHGIV